MKMKYSKYNSIGNQKAGICTRNPIAWLKLLLFYTCFYSFLAGYWATCFYVFWSNFITDEEPYYKLDESRIAGLGSAGVKPGLGVIPRLPDKFDHDHGRTYHYFLYQDWNNQNDGGDDTNDYTWVKRIHKEYFEQLPYDNSSVPCEDDSHEYHEDDVCRVSYENLGQDCGEYPYGYSNESFRPCLFLKLNRIYLFKPEPYDYETELFQSVGSWINNSFIKQNIQREPRKVYISCHGVNEETEEKIVGKFRFFPDDAGISFRYFPYHSLKQVPRSPVVALQLLPNFPKNEEIVMDCYPFFKNVVHDRKSRQGILRLNIKIVMQ